MRLLVVLVCTGVAVIANPVSKKSINAKAIEVVDQNLDALRPLESGSGQNMDRSKKDVTFCVEVRQDNKPVVVDCNDRQPIQPAPSTTTDVQTEPQPESQPQPMVQPFVQPSVQPSGQPMVQPFIQPNSQVFGKPQAHTLNIEVPCEPEMAAYVIQPPEQVVYAPTGNCFPQMPSVVQVPTATATAPAQVFHVPSAHQGLHTHHPIQVLHGGHAPHGTHTPIKPLHTHVVKPSVMHHHHGIHPLNSGVECTCHTTNGADALGKSAEPATPMASMNNEALALKFLQDLQRNAAANSEPFIISGQSHPGSTQSSVPAPVIPLQVPASATPLQISASTAPMQSPAQVSSMQNAVPASAMRYISLRPMSNMQPQLAYPQLSMTGAGGQMMYNPGMVRMKSLEDSFTTGSMIPSIRACRDDGEEASSATATSSVVQQHDSKITGTDVEINKPSPSELIEQMKKNDKEDAKNPRIARFIMDKDEAENKLEDN